MNAPFSAALAVGARTRVPDRFVRHGCGGWVAVKVLETRKKRSLDEFLSAIALRAKRNTHLKSYGLLDVVAGVKGASEFWISTAKVRFFASPWHANHFGLHAIRGCLLTSDTLTHSS